MSGQPENLDELQRANQRAQQRITAEREDAGLTAADVNAARDRIDRMDGVVMCYGAGATLHVRTHTPDLTAEDLVSAGYQVTDREVRDSPNPWTGDADPDELTVTLEG